MLLRPSTLAALWSLLFITSAGAHTVVATVPAASEANIWIGIPSDNFRTEFDNSSRFASVYLIYISMVHVSESIWILHHYLRHIYPIISEMILVESVWSGMRTHQDASNNIRTQSLEESSYTFLFPDSQHSIERIWIIIPLSQWFHSISAHPN